MMRCTSTEGSPPPLLLTFGGLHSYFVARKGGLVHSQACYALRDGGVTDVAGRTDRGTRRTCKRGQEQDWDGTRLG